MTVMVKVGGQSAVADCIRQAMAQRGCDWKLVHVSTLNQARLALKRQAVDVLVLHHRLPDGEVLGAALELPDGVLRMLSIEPGMEALAAQALDAGFDDYLIEQASPGFAEVMLAQIRAALRHREAGRALAQQHGVLQAISRAQALFIRMADNRSAYQVLLDDLLALTHSSMGFVGEVVYEGPAGQPQVQVHAISNVAWDAASRQRYADLDGPGLRFTRLDTLFGAALVTGEPVLSNQPHSDARAGGLPKGHPPLRSFMALPVGEPGRLRALIGLANRPGGYGPELVQRLQPLLETIGQLVDARRAQRERAQLLRNLQTALDTTELGLLVINAQGHWVLHNRRLLDLLALTEEELARCPRLADLLAYLRARGDYGPDGQWIEDEAVRRWLLSPEPAPCAPADVYRRRTRAGRTLEVRNWWLPSGEVVRTFRDVSEELRRLQDLADARERLATTLDGTRAGTWEWNVQTDAVSVSARFAELVGYRLEEMPTTVQALYALILHPEDRARLDEANARHLRGEVDHYECQFRFRHRSGRVIWVLERGRINQRTPDGKPLLMSGITLDVTDSKRAEDALRVTSELLRERSSDLERTLDAMSQGLMVVGPDERVRLFNRRLCDILNLPASYFAAQPTLADLLRLKIERGDFGRDFEQVEPVARPYLRAAGQAPVGECPRRFVRRTPSGRYLEVKTEPLAGGGLIRTYTDVTPFVEATEAARQHSEEVRRLNETLEQRVAERTAQLERSMHDIEALSYSIAHDLRGPLRAVNGFAALIAADEAERLSPQGRELFARITEASRRMGVMITDLLQLFKVVRAELTPEPVDLEELVRELVRTLAAAYPSTRVRIDPLPTAVGDAALLRILVGNLLDNALKYSARASQPQVHVGWDEAQRAWFVRDNGVGFDMAQAGKLFGLFQRLHTSADFDGTGLGLAVAQRIAQRHGGRIWAEAAVGQGACFWFSLGASAPSDAAPGGAQNGASSA